MRALYRPARLHCGTALHVHWPRPDGQRPLPWMTLLPSVPVSMQLPRRMETTGPLANHDPPKTLPDPVGDSHVSLPFVWNSNRSDTPSLRRTIQLLAVSGAAEARLPKFSPRASTTRATSPTTTPAMRAFVPAGLRA